MGIVSLEPPESVPTEVLIELESSKSISNRVQIIQALCAEELPLENLSQAKDSLELRSALTKTHKDNIHAGSGGTTFRFLTAYLALKGNNCLLTASEGMTARPVGPLVEALRQLGAQIEYAEKEGHPPLLFKGGKLKGGKIHIAAGLSSQYISALMMIAPYLPGGLTIELSSPVTSLPYISMTAGLMEKFGAIVEIKLPNIRIDEQHYSYKQKDPFVVESDWSGASYFWGLASILPVNILFMEGLQKDSLQGDSVLSSWALQQGFSIDFTEKGAYFEKNASFRSCWTDQLDLTEHPDLAQTVLALYAIAGKAIKIRGLHTLFHKETDRLNAMQTELQKLNIQLDYTDEGTAQLRASRLTPSSKVIEFDTYKDHRMAMALSLFGGLLPIKINEAETVEKSFPSFWQEIKKLGFSLKYTTH